MNNDRPPTLSETELYRVLERANLLIYYPAFISKGGDDVQQLYEASEQEFTEITNLVGMSGKPLHIRRLQKALAEWHHNPRDFQQHLPSGVSLNNATRKAAYSRQSFGKSDDNQDIKNETNQWSSPAKSSLQKPNSYNQPVFPGYYQPLTTQQNSQAQSIGFNNQSRQNELNNSPERFALNKSASFQVNDGANSNKAPQMNIMSPLYWNEENSSNANAKAKSNKSVFRGIPVSLLPNAVLKPADEVRIEACSKEIIRILPDYPIKKKTKDTKLSQMIKDVILMPVGLPNRDTEIRRYSAIYGRFDTPRKTGRPMSNHEVAVNEASFRLALCMPNLLTRREDLYPIARQIVKLSEVTVKLGLFDQVPTMTSTDDAILLLNKHLSESKCIQAGGPYPTEGLRDPNISDLASIQNGLGNIKSDLNAMIEEQNALRISFRAAKASFASIAIAEVQKQITALGGSQQRKLEELGGLILRQKQLLNILTSDSYQSNLDSMSSVMNGDNEYSIKKERAMSRDGEESFDESTDSKSIGSSSISFTQNSNDLTVENSCRRSMNPSSQLDIKPSKCSDNGSEIHSIKYDNSASSQSVHYANNGQQTGQSSGDVSHMEAMLKSSITPISNNSYVTLISNSSPLTFSYSNNGDCNGTNNYLIQKGNSDLNFYNDPFSS